MGQFRCRLATATGEIVERDMTADDAAALRRELERQDYLVLAIDTRSGLAGAVGGILRRRKKVHMGEFLVFNQEFAALIRAGLPIVESLSMLTERRKNPVFRAALGNVRDRVKGGEALSDAFAAQEIFPPLYASTLASGERSGEIATVLTRYIRYVQTIQGVRRKVTSALIYPAILITMAIVVTLVLLVYVLPNFQDFFTGFGSELPFITRAVIGMSNTLRGYGLFIVAGLIGGGGLFAVWKRTGTGQRAWETFIYRIPLVGGVMQQFVVTRLSRTLGTLVAGGIPLVTCLEIAGRSIGTPRYADAVSEVGNKVREGGALWSSLEETHLCPDLMVEMVKIGESSGSLAEMLEYVSDFLDQEIDTRLQRVIALVEPLLLVFMAVIVGTLLLSIYYPMLMAYSSAASGI